MDKPILSICIVTYNRSARLDRCLASICAQFSDPYVLAKTQIVVSDNCSKDNTAEVVAGYQGRFANIVYSKNPVNLGMDLNLANSIEKASGKYCWYMGDDDVVAPGALLFLTKYLSANEVATLIVRDKSFSTDEELKELLKVPLVVNEQMVAWSENPEDAHAKGYLDGALSSHIVLREPWLEALDKNNFFAPWLYFEVILKMISKMQGKKFANADAPLIYLDQACEWVKNGTEFYILINLKRMWASMGRYGYSKVMLDQQAKNLRPTLLLMLSRAKGHDLPYKWQDYKSMVREFRAYPFYLAVATLIYLTPNPIVKLARDFKKAVV